MRDSNKFSRSGGRGRVGRDFQRRDFGRRGMFKAVCDNCGDNCEVPFKPSNDKPIYCSKCFEEKGGNSGRNDSRSDRRNDRGSSREQRFVKRDDSSKQLLQGINSINEKLERIIKVIEPGSKKEPKTKSSKAIEVTEKIVKKDKNSKEKKSKDSSKKKTTKKSSKKE